MLSNAEAPICQTNMKLFVKFNLANSKNSTIKIQKYRNTSNELKYHQNTQIQSKYTIGIRVGIDIKNK